MRFFEETICNSDIESGACIDEFVCDWRNDVMEKILEPGFGRSRSN